MFKLRKLFLAVSFLPFATVNAYAVENYDDKLQEISKTHPSFAGLHVDENGDTVISLSNSSAERSEGVDLSGQVFKSQRDLSEALNTDLIAKLGEFYGAETERVNLI